MNERDELFRKWYDNREGIKSESFAYDVWCDAWEASKQQEICHCINPVLCDLHDKCIKTH